MKKPSHRRLPAESRLGRRKRRSEPTLRGFETLEARYLLDAQVNVRLAVVDTAGGAPLAQLVQNQDYFLEAYVSDVRAMPSGVQSAYIDVLFGAGLVDNVGPITHGAEYNDVTRGTISSGMIDDGGGQDTDFTPPANGGDEFLLIRVPFRVVATGTLAFNAEPSHNALFPTTMFGAGGATVPDADFTFQQASVNVVSESPTITAIGNQTIDEDTDTGALTFTVGDADGVTPPSQLVVTATSSNPAIIPQDAAHLVLGGSGANRTITVIPAANANGGPTTITVQVTDGDNNTTSTTFDVSVNAVNDPPVNTVPAAQTISEDTALVFSTAAGNSISVADPDLGSNPLEITLTASQGTISLGSTTGLTFASGDGTGDASMVFEGTLADVNAALNGLTFVPASNFSGQASLQIQSNDQGATGTGGAGTDTDTVAITVTAVNDAPQHTVPGAQTTAEDTSLVFSTANGNAVSISDVDAGAASIEVTLAATQGTLTLSQTTGLTFSDGNGAADSTMTFSGSLTDINAALAGLAFDPPANFSGTSVIQLASDDQGATGSGGAQQTNSSFTVTVTNVNDPPVNTVPPAQTVNEDTALIFSTANGNAMSVSDVDDTTLTVTLTATQGVLTLSGTTGLTFTAGDGTDDASMTFAGTIASINSALNGLRYDPTDDFSGTAQVQISTSDSGAPQGIDTDTVAVTVNAVNDAPAVNVPAAQGTNPNTALTFSAQNGNALTVTDVDAGTDPVAITLSVTNGTFTLDGTTGLSFTVGDGSSDVAMTFTGSLADINAALDGATFTPTNAFEGTATLVLAANDQGNNGSGGPQADSGTVNITVNAVNDPPVITAPAAATTDEDVVLVFSTANGNAISINDSDAGTNAVQVTLVSTNGAASLSATTGLTFSAGDGTGDTTMTFTGSLSDINAALNGLAFAPSVNVNGTGSLQITVNDQGNTGTGGAQTDAHTVNITIDAVNDGPIATAPASATTNENTAVVFSAANNNAISVADIDAAAGPVEITLSSTNGTLSLSGTTGLTFTAGDGTDDTAMTFTGTVNNVNAALNGLTFEPANNFVGVAAVQVEVDDQGNTGSGGAQTDSATVNVTVGAVNSPPVITSPSDVTANEDATIVFSAANGNAISIADPDAGSGPLQVTLTASDGDLTLSSTSGLNFTVGDGTADASMTFTGTVTAINAALNGVALTPDLNSNGVSTLQILVSDQGNTGSGGAQSDSATVNVTLNAVNDAPVVSLPATASTTEDTPLVFSTANANAVSIADVDAGTNPIAVTLTVASGTLSLSGTTGLTFTAGDGTGDASMTFTGTLANVNAALNGMTLTPASNFNGFASLQVTADDQGHSGSGGAKSDSETLTVTVGTVNDPPVNSVPAAQTVAEDGTLTFSTANGNAISVSDVDGTSLTVELAATQGVLSLSGTTGLTFTTGDGANDASMTFSGTITAINAALNGLQFKPAADFDGAAQVQITSRDTGTPQGTDSDTVAVTVTAVNDAPVVDAPANQGTNQNTDLVFSTANGNLLQITDSDALTDPVQVTITATSGTFSLDGTTGLTFTAGDGTNDSAMTFSGTLANINAALSGARFSPTNNFEGVGSVVIAANDQGNNGSGGPQTDAATVNITVNATNDPPVLTAPASATTGEDTNLVFSVANGNAISVFDQDAGGNSIEVSLTATQGTLTLASIAGLTFTIGDGTGDANMTFTGTQGAINNALNGLTFSPVAAFSGTAAVQITVDDQGFTGTGGPQTDSATVNVTVTNVNDAPVITSPATVTTNEDISVVFSTANGNAIAIADSDAGTSPIQVTLTAANGTLTLAATTGLTFTTGDGTGDASMTFTGTLANVNAALNGMSLAPQANFNGTTTLVVLANDQGNTGSGGALSDDATVNVTVNAVNDAPVVTIPATASTPEGTSLVFSSANNNAISISDVDAGTNPVSVTLTASNGTLTLSGTTGLTFTSGDGTGDATMTFSGTLASINGALNGASFTPAAGFGGVASIQVAANDQGNTGSGGARTDSETLNVTVSAVNEAPVITRPATATTNEDTALVFSTANGNAISVADSDAGTSPVVVTLTAANGLVTLSGTTGLTFTSGDGSGDATMTFSGSLSAINAALNGLSFAPTANFNGTATLQVVANDQGNTGSGGAQSDSETVSITVNAVNDAPVVTIPAPASTNENTAVTFSTANSNAISIADIDAGTGPVQVTLTAANGTVTLSGTTGLTFTAGDGTGDATMTFTGTLANVNAALNGLSLTPTSGFSGNATLQVTANDQGNTGSGGALTDSETLTVTVGSVNDPPVITRPATASVNEDTTLVFSTGNNNVISIADPDAGTSPIRVTLTAASGTLTLGSTTGLTFTAGDGTGDATMTFTGTVTSINAALNGLSFNPTANFAGNATLTIVADDQGNTGTGGAKTDNETLTITVNAVNDAPVLTVPAAQSTNEDTALVFSSANNRLISVADIDAGTGAVRMTLTATNGTVTLSGTTGLTFTAGDGTSDTTMTFTGTVSAVNTALAGLTLTPTADFSGNATLAVTVDDQGNTGSGGALTDSETITVTVNAVNDAPVNTVPGAQTTRINTALVFSSGTGRTLSVADADAGTSPLQVTVAVTNGTLTLSQTTGLTFTAGDGTSDTTMTFTGTAANINAALNGLSYTPTTGFTGNATLTLTTSDQGATGSGGTLQDTDTVQITVDVAAGTLAGSVFVDGNNNGVRDANENGIPGVTIRLTGTAGGSAITPQTVTTGDDGTYSFTGLAAGTYTVEETQPAVFVDGASIPGSAGGTAGTNQITGITMASGGTSTGNNFSEKGLASPFVSRRLFLVSAPSTLQLYKQLMDQAAAANDPPVVSIPSSASTNTGTALVLSTANANAISVADPDAGTSPLQITLTATSGTVTLAGTTGLTFTTGDGTSDASMTFTGTLTNINTALNGLTFTPTAAFTGTATLQVTANDQGNTGTGGARSDTKTLNITVGASATAPVITIPATQTTSEETAIVFSSANSRAISVADSDAGTSPLRVQLTANNGTITLGATTGLTFTTGDGTSDAAMTFTGTLANINTALSGLSFTPAANFSGNATLVVNVNDQATAAQSDNETVTINVTAVNDAPTLTAPSTASSNLNTAVTFSTANGNAVSVADVDAGTSPVQVTLTSTNGTASLSTTSGLTFSAGDGTSDATMTFTGTLTAVNAALNGLSFSPSSGFSGTANLVVTANDQGNTGTGGALSATRTIGISVNAENDAPTITVPAAQTTNEDTALVFSSANSRVISVADPDAAANPVRTTLTASNGTLTLPTTTGLTFTAGDGTGDATMTFTGTLSATNAALNGLSFSPTASFAGTATIAVTVDDQGNSGTGGAKTDTETVTVTVSAVNDAPTATIPSSASTAEDTPVVFSTANSNAITLADPDAGTSSVRVTLTGTNGTMTLASTTGLTFTTGDGSGDATLTFTSSLSAANAALNGLSFTPSANFTGNATLLVTINDQGNTGSGGALSDTKTLTITVSSVNDAPDLTGPATASTNTSTPLVFSGTNNNAIALADPDAGTSPVQVSLSITNGTATLGSTSGLTFTTGDGSADTAMTFTGTVTSINAALTGLTYTPTSGFNGTATLTINANDQGNTGTGGARTDSYTATITVNAENDAPVITAPSAQTTNEDTPLVFSSANQRSIIVSDSDAGSSPIRTTLTAANGTLTLATTSGLTFTAGDGTADATMTFTGSQTAVNAALNGLTFTPTSGFEGTGSLQISVDDQGNTGTGGAKTDSETVSITVAAANDAPVVSIPTAASTNEDVALVLSTANGNAVSVTDSDAGSSPVRVTLTATNGTVTLAGTSGLTFTAGDGTGDTTATFTGTLTSINAALNGLSFTPTANFAGTATLVVTANDQGNTGAGGAQSDTETLSITVNSVNDAPVVTAPATATTANNTSLVFSQGTGRLISVADADAGTSSLQMTVAATNGTVTLASTSGLTFSVGDGTSDTTMTFTGTVTNINTALNGLSFSANSGFTGNATLQVTANDQGNTGSGGALSDSETVAITVTAAQAEGEAPGTFQFDTASLPADLPAGGADTQSMQENLSDHGLMLESDEGESEEAEDQGDANSARLPAQDPLADALAESLAQDWLASQKAKEDGELLVADGTDDAFSEEEDWRLM